MEYVSILLFCAALIACGILGISILYGLLVGLVIFSVYAVLKHFPPHEILRMIWEGIKEAKGVLITFMCIGMLTGIWRACGTIPALVSLAASACVPAFWPLIAFLCNAAVSFLIGTAFGTAATMGVVSMMMGQALGLNPMLMGGAILSGCFFGDRCSPVSSSALLVAELTHTTVPENIPRMLESALVPLLGTILLYGILGFSSQGAHDVSEIGSSITAGFTINFWVYVPAVLVLVLSLVKLGSIGTLLVSSLAGALVFVFVQNPDPLAACRVLCLGFAATGEQTALLNGGGIASMLSPAAIVCIASAYSGIFRATGLLQSFQKELGQLARRTTSFVSVLIASGLTSMLACNQTLAIMLTRQLCEEFCAEFDAGGTALKSSAFALQLEDTVVIMAPLVPWSIACTVPLVSIGAPLTSVLFAFFLYMLPLWGLARSLTRKGRSASPQAQGLRREKN